MGSAARSIRASASSTSSARSGTGEIVRFEADDSFPLTGTLFRGDGGGSAVLISSAAAVPQSLYAGFAQFLVERGAAAVLTYDYRGTSASQAPKGWRARINMKDWGALDMPAAAHRLQVEASARQLVGLGQSYGGQALGLSGASHLFERYAMVASMSGYHRLLADRTVWPKMNMIGLPVTLMFGRMPSWTGIGETLPGSVFRDWARWCRTPDYFFSDPGVPETRRFAEVKTPILAIGMTDDPWGTPQAIRALTRHYVSAPIEERWIAPADAGNVPIGHLGYFRSRFRETLWQPLADWLLTGAPMTIGSAEPSVRRRARRP